MRYLKTLLSVTAVSLLLCSHAFATSLWFEPGQQTYDYGDVLTYDLYADIDPSDAIMGFGFDLCMGANGTASWVKPDDTVGYLTFKGFEMNSDYFVYNEATYGPSWYDNGDGIFGEVDFFADNVSGDIKLGTFTFEAINDHSAPLGIEYLSIGPAAVIDSFGQLATFGLIRGDITGTAFMPNNPCATAAPVPEPATLLLFGSGLVALAARRRKTGRIAE